MCVCVCCVSPGGLGGLQTSTGVLGGGLGLLSSQPKPGGLGVGGLGGLGAGGLGGLGGGGFGTGGFGIGAQNKPTLGTGLGLGGFGTGSMGLGGGIYCTYMCVCITLDLCVCVC